MSLKKLLPLILLPSFCFAQTDEPELTPEQQQAAYEAYLTQLIGEDPYLQGDVSLPGDMATLHLPTGYRFLPAAEAKKIVVDLWGNPPETATDTLGMILPEGQALEQPGPGSWAVVVELNEEGYVSDEDADEIDYDELLEQMQEGARQSNDARVDAGYGTIEIVGWALPPHYDKEKKVLHWAKELKFGGEDGNTINYDVRVLGRRGVLNLQAVAGTEALPAIQDATSGIVDLVEYNPGHRYADFDPETDEKSDLSLAGLVVGGAVAAKLAAKAGILAKLGLVFAKGWKLILIAVAAVGGLFKKLRGREA